MQLSTNVYKIQKFFLHSFTFFGLFFTLKKILHTFVDIFAYICYHGCIQNVNKKGYIMGMIRVSDDTAKKLKKIGDGRSMTATIEMLINNMDKDKNNEILKCINDISDKISSLERTILKQSTSSIPTPSFASVPMPPYASAQPQPEDKYEDDYKPDRTYTEILEEMKQLREELKTLDDDDPKRKEIENRLRADSVDLSLLED